MKSTQSIKFLLIFLSFALAVTACSTGPAATQQASPLQAPTNLPSPQPSPTLQPTAIRTPYPTATPIVVEGVGQTVQTIQLPNKSGLFPAFAMGSVWVPSPGLLIRIDPTTRQIVAEITVDEGRRGDPPYAVAADGNTVWATEMIGASVVRIDPQTNEIVDRIPLEGGLHAIALDGDTLWVANPGNDTLMRVDTQTKQIVARIPVNFPSSIAIGAGSVWTVEHRAGNVLRIDPNTNSVVATIPLGSGAWPSQLTFGEGAIWVGDLNASGIVSRIDPELNQVVATISTGIPVTSIEVGAGAVWAVVGEFEGCQKSGLVRIDSTTNTVVGRIPVRCAGDMVVSPEGFWVTSYQYKELTLVEPQE